MASDSDDDYQDNFQESDAYVDSGDDSDFEAAPPTKVKFLSFLMCVHLISLFNIESKGHKKDRKHEGDICDKKDSTCQSNQKDCYKENEQRS